MTYKLDENAKEFSYTPEELFDCVARIVSHPHTVITDHDKARAMAIFLTFSDYLSNYTESDSYGGHCVYERDATDFEGYVMEMLGLDNSSYGEVDAQELLK
jgi:hypothetical protein